MASVTLLSSAAACQTWDGVSGKYQHQGVYYSVEPVGERRWRWEVTPPTCVLGLKDEIGEVDGSQSDAIHAARRAIEAQVGMN
jgi:hypothetical protein